jgi:hypothetical protein
LHIDLEFFAKVWYDSYNMDDNTRPFMTTGDVVQLAHVHPNTVAMWRLTKKIVAKDRIGSSFLYDREEVLKFLAERAKVLSGRKTKK